MRRGGSTAARVTRGTPRRREREQRPAAVRESRPCHPRPQPYDAVTPHASSSSSHVTTFHPFCCRRPTRSSTVLAPTLRMSAPALRTWAGSRSQSSQNASGHFGPSSCHACKIGVRRADASGVAQHGGCPATRDGKQARMHTRAAPRRKAAVDAPQLSVHVHPRVVRQIQRQLQLTCPVSIHPRPGKKSERSTAAGSSTNCGCPVSAHADAASSVGSASSSGSTAVK